LVFHSSTIAMMHGPINIRLTKKLLNMKRVFSVQLYNISPSNENWERYDKKCVLVFL